MAERPTTRIGNLGKEFLDKDPQHVSDRDEERELLGLANEIDDREAENPVNVNYAGNYEDDVATSGEVDAEGPMSTDFLTPAPSQPLNADEEPGEMHGSTADELLHNPGPDGIDLGDTENDTSGVTGAFREMSPDQIVELQQPNNVTPSTSLEDQLSTDLPAGGTFGTTEEIVDPDTGELTDYDDSNTAQEERRTL